MKKFTFKYDPHHSVRDMLTDMERSIKTGIKNQQSKNVILTNDIAVIYQALTKPRLDLYAYLLEKQPLFLSELAQLLSRDYQEVESDLNLLADLGLVRLKKQGSEIRPIARYEKIVIEVPALISKPVAVAVPANV